MRYHEFYVNLMEAQNYANMFDAVHKALQTTLDFDGTNTRLLTTVTNARRTLLRNDRIVWYLRWYRIFFLRQLVGDDPSNQAIAALFAGYVTELARQSKLSENQIVGATDPYVMNLRSYQHFLSLPIAAIQGYQFAYQLPSKVIDDFKIAEKQWQEEANGSFAAAAVSGAEIVVQFPNGLAWYLLNAAYCPLEAKAMGHCGNQPRQGSTDRILSLRQTIKKQGHSFLKPYLTFILRQDGTLGEMKGRFNQSPKNAFAKGSSPSDFHREIVALLKLPLIKGITGGGYMADENFKLSDLPKAESDALAELKPSLLTIAEQYRRFGMTDDLGRRISEAADEAGKDITYDPQQKGFRVATYDSVAEFVKQCVRVPRGQRQPTVSWVLDVLSGDEHLEHYTESADDDGKTSILHQMRQTYPDAYKALVQTVEATYRENFDIDDDDDLPPLLRMINELDDEIDSFLINACLTATERGAENEMSEAADKWIADLKQGGDHWVTMSSDHWADSEITLMFAVPEVIKWMEQDDFDSNIGDVVEIDDISEPYHGFSGFDEEAGAQQFVDELLDNDLITLPTATNAA